jgi:hypothetical protein
VTVLVGVRCSDGVAIGADSIATSAAGQLPLIHLESDPKIRIFNNRVIVATSGPVGYAQRLDYHIQAAVDGGVFTNFTAREAVTNIPRRFLPDLHETKAPNWGQDGLRFGALIAAVVRDGPFLAEFGSTDFQPELKNGRTFFVSIGSGQILADPFLAFVCRVLWKGNMPDVDHGKFGVYWVLLAQRAVSAEMKQSAGPRFESLCAHQRNQRLSGHFPIGRQPELPPCTRSCTHLGALS